MNRAMLFSSAMDYYHLTTLIIPNYVKTNNTTVCHECCIASGKICLLNRFTFYTSQRSVGRFSRIRPVFAYPLETPVSHAHCKNRGRSKMRQCALPDVATALVDLQSFSMLPSRRQAGEGQLQSSLRVGGNTSDARMVAMPNLVMV